MEEQEKCQCQSSTHGHKPGNCPQPAVDDGLCKECNEENRQILMGRDRVESELLGTAFD